MKILFLYFIQFTAGIKQDFNLPTQLILYNNYYLLFILYLYFLFIISYLHLEKISLFNSIPYKYIYRNYTIHGHTWTSVKACFFHRGQSLHLHRIARWPEEEFSFRRHACRLCARNKIRSPGTERGPIKFAKLKSDYSGL